MGAPAHADLRSFTAALRQERELVEIDVEVDPDLEVAEIHRRVIAAGGPALLFRRVRGADFALVTNLFGSERRVDIAFGGSPERVVAQAARLPEELMPPTLGKLWRQRSILLELARVGSRASRRAPVREVLQAPPALTRLPATKSWPRDGGRFLTLPLVLTRHPRTGVTNLGLYRMQLFGDAESGLHMQIQKGGGFHLAACEAESLALPVNAHLGGPPAAILAAIAPLPENVPELLLASLVLGRKLELAENPSGPLPLLANAEMALVGTVEPGSRRPEGPFGDHYGYYSEVHDYPLLRVDAVLHRRDAMVPATVVGKPRQEDFFLGDALQRLLAPLLPLVMPGVRDLWSYGETGYHSLSAAIVRERYKREAMVSAFRILGEGQLSLTKFLLVTDGPVDLRDFKRTLVHVLERADFRVDLFLFANLSMDSLDYAGPRINEGSKGVLLGLGEPIRRLPAEWTKGHPQGTQDVRVFAPGCLVVQAAGFAQDQLAPQRVAADPSLADWPLVVLADDAARAAKSSMNFLWTTFTRFDPSRDVHAARVELEGTHAAFHAPIVIDARMKPHYPEELFCDPSTARLVERRWKDYFASSGARVEMGDSDRAHLD
jgi:UbiD family decarboxylase